METSKEFKGTRLTLTIGDNTATWESPYMDHNVPDILQALRGLMVTQTFIDESFIRTCGEIYEDNICLYDDDSEDDDIDKR